MQRKSIYQRESRGSSCTYNVPSHLHLNLLFNSHERGDRGHTISSQNSRRKHVGLPSTQPLDQTKGPKPLPLSVLRETGGWQQLREEPEPSAFRDQLVPPRYNVGSFNQGPLLGRTALTRSEETAVLTHLK